MHVRVNYGILECVKFYKGIFLGSSSSSIGLEMITTCYIASREVNLFDCVFPLETTLLSTFFKLIFVIYVLSHELSLLL